MSDGTPIAYGAVPRGLAVRTRAGRRFATVEHVLQIPAEDLFDGLVVATPEGLRFVDRDQIATITDVAVTCDLDDAEAGALPAPDGPPVYGVDAFADQGASLHDRLGRLFHRPHWQQRDE